MFRFGVRIQFLVSLSDRFISVMNSTRPRHTVSSKGTLLNTIRANTVTFENSFYCRAPRIWNTLPTHLRNTDCSVARDYSLLSVVITCISLSLFMMSTPRRPLRVCVLSATLVGHWTTCSIVCVVDFFIGVLPNSVFAFLFLFCRY